LSARNARDVGQSKGNLVGGGNKQAIDKDRLLLTMEKVGQKRKANEAKEKKKLK